MHRFLMFGVLLWATTGWAQATPSPTLASNPFQIKGVAVVLSQTTGFARDVALEQAARQALPQVLQGALGLPAAEANRKARAVGEAMRFVARYQVLQEAVLPAYSLTADLTFNESMLRKNFGGVASTATATQSLPATAASPSVSSSMPASMPATQAYVVRISEPTAAGQDRARRQLAALPGTEVTYRLISGQGVELNVRTGQTNGALAAALAGWQPIITPVAPEAVPVQADATPEAPTSEALPATAQPRQPAQPAAPPSRRPAWLPDLW